MKALKFSASSAGKVWRKRWGKCEIAAELPEKGKGRIRYGAPIRHGGGGGEFSRGFEQGENLVVLECVCRLLDKGYKPEHLTLEKQWRLGRSAKGGRADIVVRSRDSDKTLLIIECKTWGAEYEREQKNMRAKGGQLFSYFQQDKSTGLLALYASRLDGGGGVQYQNGIVRVSDNPKERQRQAENPDDILTYEKATTVRKSLEVWEHKRKGKTFEDKGIFEGDCEPYNPGFQPLRICDLQAFNKGAGVYDKFMKILRHNNISDRSNAFNRFISLVLAKMEDESSKKPDDVADFQFKPGIDDAESLYERLQALYTRAMRNYLREKPINHTLETIRNIVEDFPRQTSQDELYRIYRELKLYSNNEFAFKEVYNKKLFLENAKVLEEMILLLQPWRFRYDEKSQFLGKFFELMLESGYKQTEGQFFTPTPIARFIVGSMPLANIIHRKVRGSGFPLPLAVDFACGSGHFLTESIEATRKILESDFADSDKLADYRGHTRWARDCVWGVERDYRLARTSKVACFMHGDGDANIVFGDGLEQHPMHHMPEGGFDILVANPPYSIAGFKQHSKADPKNFALWGDISELSDDIEVAFLERIGQLLKTGGMAGVIFPATILDNPGIYAKAREILLRRFLFRAVVSLGGKAFEATGTQTVILFLQKRDDRFGKNACFIAHDFIVNNDRRKRDFIDSKETYADFLRHRGFGKDKGESHWERIPDSLLTEYRRLFASVADDCEEFKRRVVEAEKEKFYHFLLTRRQVGKARERKWMEQQTYVFRNSGSTKAQKRFLGYYFKTRRGHEGLHSVGDGLLCDKDARAADPGKINHYIASAFEGEYVLPSPAVAPHANIAHLLDLLNFDGAVFNNRININAVASVANREVKSRWAVSRLGDLDLDIRKGTAITESQAMTAGDIPVIAGGVAPAYYHNKANREGSVITVSASGNAGYVAYHVAPIFASDCTTIQSKNEEEISLLYVFYYLQYQQESLSALARGAVQQHVYPDDIKNFRIPLPPAKVQKKIAAECAAIDGDSESAKKEIVRLRDEIDGIIGGAKERRALGDCAELIRGVIYGKNDQRNDATDNVVLTADNITLDGELKIVKKVYLRSDLSINDKCKLRAGDIFISMNSGSKKHIGKCAYVAADADFYAGGFMRILRAKGGMVGEYLFYAVNHPETRQAMRDMSRGSNIQNIGKTIGGLSIIAPSPAKQKQILTRLRPLIDGIAAARQRIKSAPARKAAAVERTVRKEG